MIIKVNNFGTICTKPTMKYQKQIKRKHSKQRLYDRHKKEISCQDSAIPM
jgi:hypothetical protein